MILCRLALHLKPLEQILETTQPYFGLIVFMRNMNDPYMTLNEDPQSQMFIYTKKTYITVENINYKKITSSIKNKQQMCKKVIFHQRNSYGGHPVLFFFKYSQRSPSDKECAH